MGQKNIRKDGQGCQDETKSYRGISQQQLPGSCLVFDGGFWLKKSENPPLWFGLDFLNNGNKWNNLQRWHLLIL